MHFIHIPKTGGTSARAALEQPQLHQYTGHYPAWYVNLPKEEMFTVVRNPYDRAVSMFYNFCGREPYPNELKDWYTTGEDRLLMREPPVRMMDSQTSYLYYGGVRVVDNILRFENLEYGMKEMFGVQIEHKNTSGRDRQLKDYYNEELQDIILNKYKCDFDNFDYSYELNDA